MSRSFVCTPCRLRLLLQNYPKGHLQQRQWLSYSSPLQQDVHQQSSRNRKAQAPLQRSNDRTPASARHAENEPRGRYSGQVLRPEQLLHELDQPQQRTLGRGRNQHPAPRKHNDAARDQRQPRSSQDSALSQKVWKLRGLLLNPDANASQDEDVWAMLKDVLGERGGSEALKNVGQDAVFKKRYYHWTIRMTERWLETLRAAQLQQDGSQAQYSFSETCPSPLQALRLWCYSSNRPNRTIWLRVLWLCARDVAEMYAPYAEASHTIAPAHVAAGLRELMGVWSLCLQEEIRSRNPITDANTSISLNDILAPPIVDWARLPDPSAFAESMQYRAHHRATKMSFSEALAILGAGTAVKPESIDGEGQRGLYDPESAAVITLGLLQSIQGHRGGDELVREFEPWMQLLEVIIKNVEAPGVPAALAQRMMQLEKHEDEVVRRYCQMIVKRLDLQTESATPAKGAHEDNAKDQGSKAHDFGSMTGVKGKQEELKRTADAAFESSPDPTKRFATLSITRLGRAIEDQDLRAVERVRQDMLAFESRNASVKAPQSLYEHLIYAFLCLRSLPIGIEMWNQMISAGYSPRTETFTVMMKGSQHLRDLGSMEYFWNKMRQTGMQPDAKAWSTRITGLMRRGYTNAGLKALGEMGHEWLVAAKAAYAREYPVSKRKKGALEASPSDLMATYKGEVDRVPRPDVVIMNSAITKLDAKKDKLIPKILTWGRSFGIEPDLLTYNALLNVSMRHGMVEEAMNIFRRMKERNIQADSSTWTVLLTAMFEGGFLDGLEPQQQESRIVEFISSLESMGAATIDQKGYALIMDRLLKTYDNPQAAQAVLANMSGHGIEPNVHMYTILMASYFQQSPPNFAAAEGLWSHIQSSQGGYGATLDSVFYDRMIEAYATHHATVGGTAPMLSFLAKMENEGKKPSWKAMELVARTLADTGEWTRLAQIVDKVRRRLREEKGGDTRYGQRSFWRFVISTGILRQEGISRPEDVMGTVREDPLWRVQGV